MCRKIEITVLPDARITVEPTDCPDEGTTCRTLSAPYAALGLVLSDVDLGNSHLVTVKLRVMDIDALADAAESCGLELVRDQQKYRWYGRSVGDYRGADAAQRHGIKLDGKCDHALRIPDNAKAYEIGVVKARDEAGYHLVWDHFDRGKGLSDLVSRGADGADMEKLTQAYGLAVVRRQAKRLGRTIAGERVLADGSVKLLVNC